MKRIQSRNPLWIFDLDGTLALIDHRRHLVTKKPPRWSEFYKQCVNDTPNEPVCKLFRTLVHTGQDVWIWSARDEVVRAETLLWLDTHVMDGLNFDNILRMRPKASSTPDDVLKRSWLDQLSEVDRNRLCGIFDDRDKVVKMWRSAGVACLQVAPGDF